MGVYNINNFSFVVFYNKKNDSLNVLDCATHVRYGCIADHLQKLLLQLTELDELHYSKREYLEIN